MLITSFLCFLLVNSIHLSTATPVETNLTSDLRLFYYGPYQVAYTDNRIGNDNLIAIELDKSNGVQAIDYNAQRNLLIWTSPRRGFWTKNSQLYTIPWNHTIKCETRQIQEEDYDLSEKDDDENVKSDEERYCRVGGTYSSYVRTNRIKRRFEAENWNPRSLAIDYIASKLYIADTTSRSISIFSLKGKNRAFIFENETLIPYEVALDPPEGWMFILTGNTELGLAQLYRVNMDGTDSKLIVDNLYEFTFFHVREKLGFEIDTINKRIYFWNSEQKVIETVDYQGNSRHIVTNATHALSLTVHKDILYWSHANTNAYNQNACYLNSCFFWSCKINQMGICINSSIKKMKSNPIRGVYGMTSIKAIDPSLQNQNIDNPCGHENGGCQQHCLLKKSTDGRLGHSCVCSKGFKLAADLKSCEMEKITRAYDDTLVQNTTNYVLALKQTRENIFPISRALLYRLMFERPGRLFYQHPLQFFEISNSNSELIDRELDIEIEDNLYVTLKNNEISRALEKQKLIKGLQFAVYQNATISKALAFDWITRNLYFVVTPTGEELGKLIALRYRYNQRNNLKYNKKRVFTMPNITLGIVETPVSMVIHPYRGYLFMSMQNGTILRLNSDGSERYLFPKVNNSILLTIDLNDDKLYWLANDGCVSYSNLDGSDSKGLIKTYSNKTEVMYVYDKWLFTKSEEHLKIWRYNKRTGQDAGTLSINSEYMLRDNIGFKVSARDAHRMDITNNPCAIKTKDCKDLCFAIPDDKTDKLKRVCRFSKSKLKFKTKSTQSPDSTFLLSAK